MSCVRASDSVSSEIDENKVTKGQAPFLPVNPPGITANVQVEVRSNVPAVFVPLDEFQRLMGENAQLRQRVQELEGRNASLI
ncbi:MAG: hypothetical protein EOP04_20005, partial [Proteobacteria bacterium]